MRVEGKAEEDRQKWEVARWQMFIAMQMHPYMKKGNKPSSPQRWIPFPWEKEMEREIPKGSYKVTDSEKEKFKELITEFIARKNG